MPVMLRGSSRNSLPKCGPHIVVYPKKIDITRIKLVENPPNLAVLVLCP